MCILWGLVTSQQPQGTGLLFQQHTDDSGGILQRQGIIQACRSFRDTQCLLYRGFAQVSVHEDHLCTVAAEGLCQVDSDGGLTLAGHGAGYQNDLMFGVGQHPQQLNAQRTDALLIGTGNVGVLNRQRLICAGFPSFEGNGRQSSQTLLIQLQPNIFCGSNRAARGSIGQQ